MENARTYGKPPIEAVVIHGGPGAAGEMAPVATEIARRRGVLEPLQTAASVGGQVAELKSLVENHADPPVLLIGFSWGAWLSLIVAARHPSLVKKLILVGCGPLEAEYAASIEATRLGRLSEDERVELRAVMKVLENPAAHDRGAAFARFGDLFSRADAYDALPGGHEDVDFRPDIFEAVWKEGAALRSRCLELSATSDSSFSTTAATNLGLSVRQGRSSIVCSQRRCPPERPREPHQGFD